MRRLALVFVLGMSGTLSASSADWPQWRGPDRNGLSTETGLLPQWPASGLPTEEITFEFDPSNGDLVDIEPSDLEDQGADGAAVLALSNDAIKAAVANPVQSLRTE